jgi:hypothetical protein
VENNGFAENQVKFGRFDENRQEGNTVIDSANELFEGTHPVYYYTLNAKAKLNPPFIIPNTLNNCWSARLKAKAHRKPQ